MTESKNMQRVTKRISYAVIHRVAAAVSLLCFGVVVTAGIMAKARFTTIAYRAMVVILVVALVSRVVVSILASYEEMNSGKA